MGVLGARSRIFKDREDSLRVTYLLLYLIVRNRSKDSTIHSEKLGLTLKISLNSIQIVGLASTGKTSCILRFGERFEQDATRMKRQVQHVYVNLKLQ